MAGTLVFRPLTAGDLPQIHRWFHAPHARRWFDKGSLDQVAAEYQPYIEGSVPIHAFIVSVPVGAIAGGRDIGLVEWERFGDFPEAAAIYQVTDPNAANCDVLIGEPDALDQGWGPRIVRSFLQEIVFADPRVTTCIIDPSPDNAIAIRAYEKVGFRFLRALPEDGEGQALYLMELTRADLASGGLPGTGPGPLPLPYLRPARDGELAIAAAIDTDACTACAEFDPALDVTLPDDHPFVQAEVARWAEALRQRRLLLACTGAGRPVGFAALGLLEGRPLLVQLSVRRAFMRQGLGRALLQRALRWSVRPGELWLTTYQHLPFNQPWYQRLGFAPVADADCPAGIGAVLAAERAALPQGDRRTAMVYRYPRT